jgi:uncharacterized protein (TIGR00251 family)
VTTPSPFTPVRNGIHVAVHLTPKASKTAIGNIVIDADGRSVLKARVTAAPEKGKANAALCRLLAKEWDLVPSRLSVVSEATSRHKTMRIDAADSQILRDLNIWAKDRHG